MPVSGATKRMRDEEYLASLTDEERKIVELRRENSGKILTEAMSK